ncbi:energy-coupling factor ABC transporter permease [Methanocorpusculum sp. MG]|uniref:Putative cobalt transport protein CbiM n=1 Tax=Methanocorpusculum petauri TaxID=3002863 RepID=A0ABT4IJ41_9EURY|nr:energy-coupling factor ABC transporter permease [Methanocorpusculum petauri]MCZ0861108.1 energy-coupling factor ABC transporter permease [Methanocorpusculum petauri]
MHIMEGYLPIEWCVLWAVLSAPCVIYGLWRMKQMIQQDRRVLPLMAVCGAFVFVLSALKIPSVTTGSCSHPTGTGLSASFFGPWVTAVLGTIVLLFQAILLAHGGLTTLGANVFSMAIVGPFVAWLVFVALRRYAHAGLGLSVFVTAAVANLVTYTVTSLQLALAFPADGSILTAFIAFATIFAVTQIPLAIIEGIICGLVAKYIVRVKPDILKKLDIIEDAEIEKIQGEAA